MIPLTPDETILGLLAACPQHGYQLLEVFDDPARLGNVWHLSTSQLYAVLKRLEREGWIEGRQIQTENAPPRTEYATTDDGRQQLDSWLNEPKPPSSIRYVRVQFLSRLYIARLLEQPTTQIIARQRAVCQKERDRLKQQYEQNPAGFGSLANDLVIAQLEAVLGWIDQCESVSTPSGV